MSMYVLFILCDMDTIDGRKVVRCDDVPGAFLQAGWLEDNKCYLKFKGIMVKKICNIDPNYKKESFINQQEDWEDNTLW